MSVDPKDYHFSTGNYKTSSPVISVAYHKPDTKERKEVKSFGGFGVEWLIRVLSASLFLAIVCIKTGDTGWAIAAMALCVLIYSVGQRKQN